MTTRTRGKDVLVIGQYTWAGVCMAGYPWYIGYGSLSDKGTVPPEGGTAERPGHVCPAYPRTRRAMLRFLRRFVADADRDEQAWQAESEVHKHDR